MYSWGFDLSLASVTIRSGLVALVRRQFRGWAAAQGSLALPSCEFHVPAGEERIFVEISVLRNEMQEQNVNPDFPDQNMLNFLRTK